MSIDTDAEILRLRAVLRDLVALSTIPAAWIGRGPAAVADGLADALIGLLDVDFAFVRLSDPGGAGTVDAMRGDGWTTFPHWLEAHGEANGELSGKEVVSDVGDGQERYRGVVIPVGVQAEAGLVAAACARPDFPSAFDELLLSLAANYAASAFQSARLILERATAEEELRGARNQLELKVAERTAELRRSEGYLAEAQRQAHIGSFALRVPSGQPKHSSDEHSRLYGFAPEQGIPSLEDFLERIHPDDRARCTAALERGVRDAASFELEYRVALPESPVKYIRALAHPVRTASGEVEEFVGTVMDVTERKRAEEDRQAQLRFFESMDRINRAMHGTGDLERMMSDLLEVVLEIFGCDRAWLIYPCDPEVDFHRVRMEHTRPEYAGAYDLTEDIPNDLQVAGLLRTVLASDGPVRADPESDYELPAGPAERFSIKSQIAMAVYPKVDKPYMFGLHQCSHPRVWTPQDERLFEAIGRRLADSLDTLLMLRDLREAHHMVQASRDELRALADEQAALRRVATLVAEGVRPEDVFAAISEEVARLMAINTTSMLRYGADGTARVFARWGEADPAAAQPGEQSSIDAPIVVDGRLWGIITAASTRPDMPPTATESRIAAFAELLGTAIAMANSRAELTASRARIVAASDETRRRLERDLHDGVQQQLVALGLELRAAEAALPPENQLRDQLAHAATGLSGAVDELVEISRGIHPAILAAGGLRPALKTLARRSAIPAELRMHSARRLPERVEVAAYYVVSEALTNAAKHAHASFVQVEVEADDSAIELAIRDDGVGGADPARGSGLIGLTDRVEALGGRIEMASPAGRGTSLHVRIPIDSA
jgi:signal transduction histidine kinase/PAS domain-containing protein